jgi:hypothetical protein
MWALNIFLPELGSISWENRSKLNSGFTTPGRNHHATAAAKKVAAKRNRNLN